ncbi:MAG: hypothetical protein KME64_40365 [Scytonematopsis contorta HA4267-MV1]|jgi:hypothetical protein|nr:hypothetical protein [Scytonematopsis contorta HA4267-MV1]
MLNTSKLIRKYLPILLILTLIGTALAKIENQPAVANNHSFKPPTLLGLYAENYLGDQRVIDKELRQIDNWVGKKHSLAAFFMDIEDSNPNYNIGVRLERLRANGYTAFINLDTTRTMSQVANGNVDASLRKFAQAYAQWSEQAEGRLAFIAPMQEMNIGGNETYGKDPQNFKRAYKRIQQIFIEAGVSPQSIRWVFAPNGWSEANHKFEKYYPGDERVDVVAFSGYNWGYCNAADWKEWSSPSKVYQPYIKRMQKMAPGKPIFIAQTASSSYTKNGINNIAKNKWLQDTYNYLASVPEVRGILYFNMNKECDWALYNQNGSKSSGYQGAVANPAFRYVSPDELLKQE